MSEKTDKLPISKELEIDFLRGLFAILVSAGHAFPFVFDQDHEMIFLRHFFGTQYVVGFVFLSGFLIESSVRNNLKIEFNFSIKNYLFLRFSRILPLYLITICIAVFIEAVIFYNGFTRREMGWENLGLTHLFGQIFFLTGILPSFTFFASLGATTTLIYEFWFYLLWIVRISTNKIYISSFFILLILITFKFLFNINYDLVLFSIIWLSGALTSLLYNKIFLGKIYNISGYLLLIFMIGLYNPSTLQIIDNLPNFLNYKLFLMLPFALIFYGETFFTNIIVKYKKFNKFFGSISYPLFLLHGPTMLIITLCYEKYNLFNTWFGYFFLLLISILISYLFSIFVEKPIMVLRKNYKNRNKIYTTISN